MTAEETLHSTQIFLDFPKEFIEKDAAASTAEKFAAGAVIVREEDPADSFYVLQSGTIEVVRAAGTPQEHVVTRMAPGTFFGEMAILREGTRSATVRACEDCVCLVLTREAFDAELRRHPNEAAVLMPRLARRLYAIRHTQ